MILSMLSIFKLTTKHHHYVPERISVYVAEHRTQYTLRLQNTLSYYLHVGLEQSGHRKFLLKRRISRCDIDDLYTHTPTLIAGVNSEPIYPLFF